MTRKLYHGSCHCGQVQYSAAIDLAEGTARCNCTICMKMRIWHVFIKAEHFSLLSDQSSVKEYRWVPEGKTESRFRYYSCKNCSVNLFAWGDMPDGKYYGLQLTTLDDMDPDELASAPLRYEDGRHDRFDRVPSDIRLL